MANPNSFVELLFSEGNLTVYMKKGHKMSEEHKRKISEAHLGRKNSEEHNEHIRQVNLNKKHTDETKKRMSESHKKNPNRYWEGKKLSKEHREKIGQSNLGRKNSEETREKLRKSSFEYVKKFHGAFPKIGKNETRILDELEIEINYRIIRQYEIGGYFIDGYIPEINLAIEIDEKRHQYQQEKDIKRENFIKTKIGCRFLRIKDYK